MSEVTELEADRDWWREHAERVNLARMNANRYGVNMRAERDEAREHITHDRDGRALKHCRYCIGYAAHITKCTCGLIERGKHNLACPLRVQGAQRPEEPNP